MEKFQASVCARARREVVIGSTLLVVTMGSFIIFFALNYFHRRDILEQYLPGAGMERVIYNLIFAVFMYGSFAYQVSRLAFFWNVRSRVAASQASFARFTQMGISSAPHVEILVPSYKEESHTIWQTLMSAALIDYPNRSIVLLIDNPPNPDNPNDRNLLDNARRQVDVITGQFSFLAMEFEEAVRKFRPTDPSAIASGSAVEQAAALYEKAARCLDDIAADVCAGKFGGADNHTRKFFADRILREPAIAHRARAAQLRGGTFEYRELAGEFARLETMFRFKLSAFERKQYVNLSHVATKAANLNAYIGLMGRRFDVVRGADGETLIEQGPDQYPAASGDVVASISPADANYIVILDADSFLLPDYLTCMISALENPGNERVAVMQTPYTSLPNTPNPIERAAAATTDIYYYVTEGMSFARAGSWIGAAAAIRKQALLDIVVYENERGYTVPIYIQDTTVIEDTGATIDLARRGWSVQNYPARLSYSATPPDFGALVVQRRRWSNGGLIILPAALGYLVRLRPTPRNVLEGLLRVHYMIMPACISISMLAMLLYPFDFKHVSSWVYLTLPPYIYLVCRDLAQTGYRRTEFFKAYTLFLILLPVVIIGVKNSILQIVFNEKAGFGRTPKVEHRTAAPALIHFSIWGLFVWSILTGYYDLTSDNKMHAVFALSNAMALGYGMFVLIGIRESLQDVVLPLQRIFVAFTERLKRRQAAEPALASAPLPSTDYPIFLAPAESVPTVPSLSSITNEVAASSQAHPMILRPAKTLTQGNSSNPLQATGAGGRLQWIPRKVKQQPFPSRRRRP